MLVLRPSAVGGQQAGWEECAGALGMAGGEGARPVPKTTRLLQGHPCVLWFIAEALEEDRPETGSGPHCSLAL